MTLLDIKQDLINWFQKNDTFIMSKNLDDLYLLSENKLEDMEGLDAALIEKALEDFVTQKLITCVTFKHKSIPKDKDTFDEKAWVLEKPLERYTQTLELTYPTLSAVTNLVNDYCDSVKNKEAKADLLNVTEGNIQTLCLIVHQAMGGTNQ